MVVSLPSGIHAAPQEYVVMGTPLVNLRTGPSTTAMVIGRAEKGDIFKVVGQTEEWYKILMFSGAPRYVTKSDFVYPLEQKDLVDGHRMSLPASTARSRSIFWDTESGLDRAAREALEIIPATLNRERYTVLKKILEDKILLEMFHIHGIQPALYRDLVSEARKEGWR
jgi:SH3-like domain-containing protein